MTAHGILSIVPRGTTYLVRYASSNPHVQEWPPYPCPDDDTLNAVLHHWGLDAWAIQQAHTELQHGRVAVLALGNASALLPGAFPRTRPAWAFDAA